MYGIYAAHSKTFFYQLCVQFVRSRILKNFHGQTDRPPEGQTDKPTYRSSLLELKKDSKNRLNLKARIEGIIENKSCSPIWVSRPQKPFWISPQTQKSLIGAQKAKNDPQIRSKSKVRIEGSIEDNSCSAIWVDQKSIFEPYTNPKVIQCGP